MTNSLHSSAAGAPAPFPGQRERNKPVVTPDNPLLIAEGKKESNISAKRKHSRKSQLNRVCYSKAMEDSGSVHKPTGAPLCPCLLPLGSQSQPGSREKQFNPPAEPRRLCKRETPTAGRGQARGNRDVCLLTRLWKTQGISNQTHAIG